MIEILRLKLKVLKLFVKVASVEMSSNDKMMLEQGEGINGAVFLQFLPSFIPLYTLKYCKHQKMKFAFVHVQDNTHNGRYSSEGNSWKWNVLHLRPPTNATLYLLAMKRKNMRFSKQVFRLLKYPIFWLCYETNPRPVRVLRAFAWDPLGPKKESL